MALWAGLARSACAAEPAADEQIADEQIAAARQLLLTGKYQEAAEAFAQLDQTAPAVAIGLAETRLSTGEREEAEKLLRAAHLKQPAQSAGARQIAARLAQLAFASGSYTSAKDWCRQARASEREVKEVEAVPGFFASQLLARWIEAELLRVSGQLDEADRAYRTFIEDYNQRDLDDPESLLLVGKAAAHYARWNRVSDQFNFLVNELYPSIVKLEPNFWPAHLEAGLLFLEKFNAPEAGREFQKALALNPRAAEVHAAIAHLALQHYDMDQARKSIDEALAINPNLLRARQAKADLLMANFQAAEAAEYLEQARSLNPLDEATLGRLAAAYIAIDDYRPGKAPVGASRVDRLISEVTGRNEHAGEFFFTIGTRLEERRKFDVAAHFLREATARMPRMIGPHAGLGMLFMRLGEEDQARKTLKEAFEIDPFNVRVSNSLKVLEVLSGYETIETEHFLIRFDPGKDKLLAQYAARHLERVHPELCKLMGYTPAGKSLFEIFNQARNTSGHGWFSTRMVGLPYVGTVGACAGKMVAMASPNEGKQKFNWARVLKHEFVHVINLQQTNFNIPHWFTEALAVWNEGFPRPQEWDALLAERVPKGEIFNLDTINLGFARPESNEHWQLAYCQAELYAEYLLKTYGDQSLAKLLAAYADNLDTRTALGRCFAVEQAAFERGYVRYLKDIVAGLKSGDRAEENKVGDLERETQSRPGDPLAWARLALANLQREDYPAARKAANEATKLEARQPLAAYVLARLQLLTGENDEALAALEAAYNDTAPPEEHLLNLLASLKLKEEDYAGAAKLYQRLSDAQPDDIRWIKALARVYLLSKQDKPLVPILERLAERDADDVAVRKKLAALALAAENYDQAARWAQRALDIDVLDAETHRILGQAFLELKKTNESVAEYEVATSLAPKNPQLLYALADASMQVPDKAKARRALEALLKLRPDYPGATEMLEDLKP